MKIPVDKFNNSDWKFKLFVLFYKVDGDNEQIPIQSFSDGHLWADILVDECIFDGHLHAHGIWKIPCRYSNFELNYLLLEANTKENLKRAIEAGYTEEFMKYLYDLIDNINATHNVAWDVAAKKRMDDNLRSVFT